MCTYNVLYLGIVFKRMFEIVLRADKNMVSSIRGKVESEYLTNAKSSRKNVYVQER